VSAAPSHQESAELAYAPGDVIADKYQLEALLGEGGMGAVFRARNTVIDMPVAIKVIRADLDRELLSGRLLQEARAAAKLQHPAIVRVFDVGQTALGAPFIVMELLEGESLSAIMDREGRLTAIRTVQILLPIADALSAAHAKGFVHRDVKPDNVFIVMDEGTLQPKLVDFGIVKASPLEGNRQLTQVGAVMGSPDYMSPEQARGLDDIDQRADVWSFSVMVYEAIAGATPFEHDNYNALLRMIVEQDALTLKDLSAADEELSKIVARGMSKDRATRYPSLGQMGKALAMWLVDQGINEDACGVSLESKWLSRQTDPNSAAVSGSSRPSMPEWFEATSGIRNVGRRFQVAPTVPAGTPSTPVAVHASAAPTASRRTWIIAGAATLLSLSAAWLALRPSAPAQIPPAAPSVTAEAHVSAQLPTSSPLEAAEPARAPSPPATAGVATRPAAEKPAPERRPSAASRPLAPPRPAPDVPNAAAPPPPPKDDLIAPY
jgi:serine/threonine-protein kinase